MNVPQAKHAGEAPSSFNLRDAFDIGDERDRITATVTRGKVGPAASAVAEHAHFERAGTPIRAARVQHHSNAQPLSPAVERRRVLLLKLLNGLILAYARSRFAAYYREWRARDKARKVAQPNEPVADSVAPVATESTPVEAASEPVQFEPTVAPPVQAGGLKCAKVLRVIGGDRAVHYAVEGV